MRHQTVFVVTSWRANNNWQWKYILCPLSKKVGSQTSAGKAVLTMFWGSRDRVFEHDL
jgi:hypothetical protein